MWVKTFIPNLALSFSLTSFPAFSMQNRYIKRFGKAEFDQGIFNTVIHLIKVLVLGTGGSFKFILVTSIVDQSVGIPLHESEELFFAKFRYVGFALVMRILIPFFSYFSTFPTGIRKIICTQNFLHKE